MDRQDELVKAQQQVAALRLKLAEAYEDIRILNETVDAYEDQLKVPTEPEPEPGPPATPGPELPEWERREGSPLLKRPRPRRRG